MKKILSILILMMFCIKMIAQTSSKDSLLGVLADAQTDTARVNILLAISREYFNSDLNEATKYADKAAALSLEINYDPGYATALKNNGIIQYNQGNYVKAIEYWEQSLKLYKSINDEVGIANLLNNLGAIWYNQGDDAKALEYYLESLRFSEKTGNKLRIATALLNIGAVYVNKVSSHEKALEYYFKALPIAEELGDLDVLGTLSVNIGEIYLIKKNDSVAMHYFRKAEKAYTNSENLPSAIHGIGEVYRLRKHYDAALLYHQKALNIAKKLNSQLDISHALVGIGETYYGMENYTSAIEAFRKAETITEELKAGYIQKKAYEGLAKSYIKLGDYKNAFTYESQISSLKDTLFNIETSKTMMSLQSNFEIQKKQAQIDLLTKNKELQELDLQSQKFQKNSLIVGLILIFLIAFIILRNNRVKAKTNKLLDKQKAEIEKLLENILPTEVAKELQTNGYATPRFYESASVMFTDFKSFTKLADQFSPQELVSELNEYFIAFDEIIERHGLEKIKTIGDSYMCAGGLPSPDESHPFKIIEASFEILNFISAKNVKRKELNLQPWDLRIGINSGPLVAGVVGRKKYAYDIWGSTVNIANRMESNGEPGQVNISAATYQLVKSKYTCSYRGRISAKNVGEIDMYFVLNPETNPFLTEEGHHLAAFVSIPNQAPTVSLHPSDLNNGAVN